MAEQIIIEHLEFQGHCGVTEAERRQTQPIAVNLMLDYPPAHFPHVAWQDDLSQAIDYVQITKRVVATGSSRPYALLETMADCILSDVFQDFAVDRASIWVRKVSPVVKEVKGSVGVRMERRNGTGCLGQQPAQFLVDCLSRLPKGNVLDVAAGRGRNAVFLANHGFTVHGIDRDPEAVDALNQAAQQQKTMNMSVQQLDLETDPSHPPEFPKEIYDVVTVFFYLFRPLFPAFLHTLKPGGVLLYETFLIDNHHLHHHPRRKEFCLEQNELLSLTNGMRVLHYDEGARATPQKPHPTFTVRLLAQKKETHGTP